MGLAMLMVYMLPISYFPLQKDIALLKPSTTNLTASVHEVKHPEDYAVIKWLNANVGQPVLKPTETATAAIAGFRGQGLPTVQGWFA